MATSTRDVLLSKQSDLLDQELKFVKRHIEAVSSQPVIYGNNFTPSIEDVDADGRRKARVVETPVRQPDPKSVTALEASTSSQGSATSSSNTVTLELSTVGKVKAKISLEADKSLTIVELKQALIAKDNRIPEPSAQRWVLGGKVMNDNKILKEYPVETGSKINIMLKAGASASASASPSAPASTTNSPSQEIPSTTHTEKKAKQVTPSQTETSSTFDKPSQTRNRSESITPKITFSSEEGSTTISSYTSPPGNEDRANANAPPSFINTITDPSLWSDLKSVVERHLASVDADEESRDIGLKMAWEAWLNASKGWMTPTEIARIREATRMQW